MNSYINPDVDNIPAPVGVDFAIEKCRLALFTYVPWLQKRFGRAILQQRRNAKGGSEFFPEVWLKNREPLNLMPNDNLGASSFFYVRDPETNTGGLNEYDFYGQQINLQRPVSLIVWLNLQMVDPTKDYRFTEQLKLDLLKAMQRAPGWQLTQIYESWKRVLEDFTLTEHFQGYLKPPYYGIRIDGILSYPAFAENCENVARRGYLLNEDGTLLITEEGLPLRKEEAIPFLKENGGKLLTENGNYISL